MEKQDKRSHLESPCSLMHLFTFVVSVTLAQCVADAATVGNFKDVSSGVGFMAAYLFFVNNGIAHSPMKSEVNIEMK